ncbi:hypothetical protein [Streptomyces palmae]|uniref:Uncharacterized protein n=1 Tax=Streptomyces palmae TaxID=1701085 RepID=A0A4Z0HGR6_9ACTN|nr:hypothetical protein [Streptomyces palmae]TGB19593.1 hypothetical protein E4099_00110 [Streptomyces palmae]
MSGPTHQEIRNHITDSVLRLPAHKLGASFAGVWDHLSGDENVVATGVTTSGTDTLVVKGTMKLPQQGTVQTELHFTGDPVTSTTLRLPLPDWTYSDPERRDDLRPVREALYEHKALGPSPTAVVTAQVSGSSSSRVELPLSVPGGTRFVLDLSHQPHGTVLTSRHGQQPAKLKELKELAGLPRLNACTFTVPQAVPLAGGLRLAALQFVVDARRRRLRAVTIQVQSPDWSVNSAVPLLDLKAVRLGFSVAFPAAPTARPEVSASLTAAVSLGGNTVTVAATVPELGLSFAAYLDNAAMKEVLPAKATDQWEETGLSLEGKGVYVYGTADLKGKTWSLGCRHSGPWKVADTVQLHELTVEASGRDSEGVVVTGTGTVAIGETYLTVTVLRLAHPTPSGAAGWVFHGTVNDADIAAVGKWLGFDLDVDTLSVLYSFTSREFTAMCDATVSLGGPDLHLGMTAKRSSGDTALGAVLLIDDVSFPDSFPVQLTGTYASGKDGKVVDFSYESSGGLPVARLARHLGIQPPKK